MKLLSVNNQSLIMDVVNNMLNENNINIDKDILNGFIKSKCLYYENAYPNETIIKLNKMVLNDTYTYIINSNKNNDNHLSIHEKDFNSYNKKPKKQISFEKPMDKPIHNMVDTLESALRDRDNELKNITKNYENNKNNAKSWLNMDSTNTYDKGPPIVIKESSIHIKPDNIPHIKNNNNNDNNNEQSNKQIVNFLSKLKTNTDNNNELNNNDIHKKLDDIMDKLNIIEKNINELKIN